MMDFMINYFYGINPHIGTHDMIIRNNKIYKNNVSCFAFEAFFISIFYSIFKQSINVYRIAHVTSNTTPTIANPRARSIIFVV